eukprot:TRINITY_DN1385_c0_g1_i1.p1 TRINITY_DN1385_c0_g1~~TRINITY_DN1385_c0_g1_i1.p1  ORF type:complete len:134 (+),score=14.48 TRINITY_DN1385_c0_g1_i1:177-578(+)
MRLNRDELLPTTQDVVQKSGKKVYGSDLDDLLENSLKETNERLLDIQESTNQAMKEATKASNWGITIIKTSVEAVYLTDNRIIQDIDAICRSLINTSLEKYRGELNIVKANTKKQINDLKKKKVTELDVGRLV